MTRSPVLARSEGEHRFYLWGVPPEGYWSVTTIINGGIPRYLIPWASKTIADLVVADLDTMRPHSRASTLRNRWIRAGRQYVAGLQAAGKLTSIKRADRLPDGELVARWLKGTPERIRDTAADLGSDVHSEADTLVRTLALESADAYAHGLSIPDWPARLRGHMTSFQRFLEEREPVYLATEATVFHRPQAYGGTLDAILMVPAAAIVAAFRAAGEAIPEWLADRAADRALVVVVVDYKSGRSVYPTVGLQLAAYSRAEFIGLPDMRTRIDMPRIDMGAVLHLAPTGYALRLVRIDDEVFRAFLHAREVYRFNRELAGKVLGQTVFASAKEAA